MNEPFLTIPCGTCSSSADRAVYEYVRDRMDKAKFIEELIDSHANGMWLLGQVVKTYIPTTSDSISFDKHGNWRTSGTSTRER